MRAMRAIRAVKPMRAMKGDDLFAFGGADEAQEERMGSVGTALELGVELDADEEGFGADLHCLHKPAVGGDARKGQAGSLEGLAEVVVEFVSVSVALADGIGAVKVAYDGVLAQKAGIFS